MESKWIKMLINEYDQYKNDATRNNHVDLTLKLGLPSDDQQRSYSVPNMAPDGHANLNLNLNGPDFSEETNNQNELSNNKGKGVDIGNNIEGKTAFNSNNNAETNDLYYAWPPSKVARDAYYKKQRLNGFPGPFPGSASSSGVGDPIFTTNNSFGVFPNFDLNNGHQMQQQAPLIPPPPPPPQVMNDYTLIDVPARRMERERGVRDGAISGGRRRQTFIDPNKRCTNYNCNTNDTPMWRRGPLGHKTLCNACGIKYRKEEEKRKKRECAGKTNGESSKGGGSNA